MSVESKEFVALREGEYARASLGVARPEAPVEVGFDADEETINGTCRCCGRRAHIPPMMHVCRACFEEAA